MNLFLDIYRGCDKWCMQLAASTAWECMWMYKCKAGCQHLGECTIEICQMVFGDNVDKNRGVVHCYTAALARHNTICHRVSAATDRKHIRMRNMEMLLFTIALFNLPHPLQSNRTNQIFFTHTTLNVMIHHHSVTPQIVNKYWKNKKKNRKIYVLTVAYHRFRLYCKL